MSPGSAPAGREAMAGVRMGSPPPVSDGVVRLRLQGSADDGEHVALDESNLPQNIYDVTTMLRLETAPRSCWRDVAAAYMRAGLLDNGIAVLEQGTSTDVDTMLGEGAPSVGTKGATGHCSRTDLLSALAGAYVLAADVPGTSIVARQKLLRKAAHVFSRADLIDSDHPAIWCAKGQAEAAASRPLESKTWFENAHQNGQIPAALGLASFHLCGATDNPADPRKAASLLASALNAAPCPAATWTGLGFALFKAGDIRTARTVLRRAVKALSGAPPAERLEALYALARVECAEPTALTVENAVAALREAYVVCGGHSDPRVLTLLAEMRFLGGDPSGAESFALRAVEAAEDFLPTVIPGSGTMDMDVTDVSDPTSSQLPPAYAAIQRNVRILAKSELARARLELGRFEEASEDFMVVKRLLDDANSEASGAGSGGSSTTVPVNPGVYLRLGLLKLGTGLAEDLPIAEECLEKVLKVYDDRNAVAMRGLGFIIGRRVLDTLLSTKEDGRPLPVRGGENYTRAKDLLQRGIDSDVAGRKDVPAVLVYAALLEEGDPAGALAMYRNAVSAIEETAKRQEEAHEKRGDGPEASAFYGEKAEVSIEVWNNMAALMARTGNTREARAFFAEKIDEEAVKNSIDLLFNKSRLAEMDRDFEVASAGYDAVLAKDPGYHVAKIRLGCIAMVHIGDFSKAEELFKSVLATQSPMRMTAAAFLNKLYIEKKDPKAQQALLEANRGMCDYMALAFAQFMHSHLDGLGTSDRRNRFLINHIATPLQQALRRNKRNAYAANGIGVFFAENMMMSEARDAFSAAGAGGDIARSARVNLAHSTVALAKAAVRAQNDKATPGQYFTTSKVASARGLCQQADQLYADALGLTASQDAQSKAVIRERLELLLYRANAKHEIGLYRDSASILQQILHVAPESAPVWFNLGQVLRECATEHALNKSSFPAMVLAKAELEASRAAFGKAAALDRGVLDPITRTRVERKFLDIHYKFIVQTIKEHEVNLINARNEAEDKEKARIEQIAKVEEAKRRRVEMARKKEEEEKNKRLALEAAAAAAAEKLRISEEEHQKRMQMAKEKQEEDDALYESGEERDNASKPKRKRKKKDKVASEKPAKRRKGRKGEPADDISSDEYGDDEMAGFESGGEESDKGGGAESNDEANGADEDDGVIRARGRKRVLAPDSDNDDDGDDGDEDGSNGERGKSNGGGERDGTEDRNGFVQSKEKPGDAKGNAAVTARKGGNDGDEAMEDGGSSSSG